MFSHAVVLEQVMCQSGQDPDQILFRQILLNQRNGQVAPEDWKYLMKQTPAVTRPHTFHISPLLTSYG